MSEKKSYRLINIFYRCMRGDDISVKALANEFNVSPKSISRDLSEIKNFLAEHREVIGNTELVYSYADKVYRLYMDEFLSEKELLAISKIILASRGLSKIEMVTVISKLKRFCLPENKNRLDEVIRKEILNYNEIKHDCKSITDNLWKLTECIVNKKQITIHYYKMNRDYVEHKVCPLSIMFSEFYFYLIAYKKDDKEKTPRYFRVDRITEIIEHRAKFDEYFKEKFDEGKLRKISQFMFPGKHQKICFEFSGPSVQAVLDKIPTAQIIERQNGKYIVEAEVYGSGIKMFLLSQGSWVKILYPESFKEEMISEIDKMKENYR